MQRDAIKVATTANCVGKLLLFPQASASFGYLPSSTCKLLLFPQSVSICSFLNLQASALPSTLSEQAMQAPRLEASVIPLRNLRWRYSKASMLMCIWRAASLKL